MLYVNENKTVEEALQDEYGATFNNINFILSFDENTSVYGSHFQGKEYYLRVTFQEFDTDFEMDLYKVEAMRNELGAQPFAV